MRIAHLSDLHILDLRHVSWNRFANRRVLGGLNLLLNRARQYSIEVLERLIEDLFYENPDHIVVTGDLCNLALESEFERVFHYLRLLGGYDRVTVVPGNHDYYTARAAQDRRFEKFFHPFMFADGFSDLDIDIYPFVKRLDWLKIIGLNSACRTLPPFSYGTIGEHQLNLLAKLLDKKIPGEKTCVVLHHSLHRRDFAAEMTSRLINRELLAKLLLAQKVDLVLYGHDHLGKVWKAHGATTLFVCCGSSTRLVDEESTLARYRLLDVDQRKETIEVHTKVYNPETRRFFFAY